jgi:hypothetical protein
VHLALDFPGAERELRGRGLSVAPDADAFFHREFLRDLFARTVQRVRREVE